MTRSSVDGTGGVWVTSLSCVLSSGSRSLTHCSGVEVRKGREETFTLLLVDGDYSVTSLLTWRYLLFVLTEQR